MEIKTRVNSDMEGIKISADDMSARDYSDYCSTPWINGNNVLNELKALKEQINIGVSIESDIDHLIDEIKLVSWMVDLMKTITVFKKGLIESQFTISKRIN